MEEKAKPHQDQQDRERFLKTFPQVKKDLEERIRKLHALADKVDKVHRDCTISNVVATSTSAVSGILSIAGLALAPVTAGASLVLSTTAMGLGIAADVTRVTTGIVEHTKTLSAKAEARQLVSPGSKEQNVTAEVLHYCTPRIASLVIDSIPSGCAIVRNINTMKLAKAKPHLADQAKGSMAAGETSGKSSKQDQEGVGHPSPALTKTERIVSMASAGVVLMNNVTSLANLSQHLLTGAKAESAAELRRWARELEEALQRLIEINEKLREDAREAREEKQEGRQKSPTALTRAEWCLFLLFYCFLFYFFFF